MVLHEVEINNNNSNEQIYVNTRRKQVRIFLFLFIKLIGYILFLIINKRKTSNYFLSTKSISNFKFSYQ